MCDCDPSYGPPRGETDDLRPRPVRRSERPFSRRRFLRTVGGAAVGTAAVGAVALSSGPLAATPTAGTSNAAWGEPGIRTSATPLFGGLQILPRSAWGADLATKGPLYPEDSRFVLVHHTASPNDRRAPREVIRVSHAYHTGPKGWPDIAYNFMIGYDGSVWETRAGSLAGPVVADASGGSQGFAQLICLIGDFSRVPPPAAMQESLVRLIAFLAHRDSIDLTAGSTASFTSRGSDRFPSGTPVTVRTLSGHRDCTFTTCPGDVGYSLIPWWQDRARLMLTERSPFEHAERLGPA